MKRLESIGLPRMVDRICGLRAAGENAQPRMEWRKVGGQFFVAFVVVRADGTFERGLHEGETVEDVEMSAAQPECTGWAASWCPVHGTCRCERAPDGERIDDQGTSCPLHAEDSAHGWTDDAGLRR